MTYGLAWVADVVGGGFQDLVTWAGSTNIIAMIGDVYLSHRH